MLPHNGSGEQGWKCAPFGLSSASSMKKGTGKGPTTKCSDTGEEGNHNRGVGRSKVLFIIYDCTAKDEFRKATDLSSGIN